MFSMELESLFIYFSIFNNFSKNFISAIFLSNFTTNKKVDKEHRLFEVEDQTLSSFLKILETSTKFKLKT